MAKKFVSPKTLESFMEIMKTELKEKFNSSEAATMDAAIEEIRTNLGNINLDNYVKIADVIDSLESYDPETDADKIVKASIVEAIKTQLDAIIIKDSEGNSIVGSADNADKLGGLGKEAFVQRTDVIDNWDNFDDTAAVAQLVAAALIKDVVDKVNNTETLINDALDAKSGVPNGFATLDENGKVPADQLPSYVDDVIEGYLEVTPAETDGNPDTLKFYEDAAKTKEIVGEGGKIYLDVISGNGYRWSGSTYMKVGSDDLVEMTAEEIQEMWDNLNNETVTS